MRCATCGTDNPDGSRFCMSCGEALDAVARVDGPPPRPPASDAGPGPLESAVVDRVELSTEEPDQPELTGADEDAAAMVDVAEPGVVLDPAVHDIEATAPAEVPLLGSREAVDGAEPDEPSRVQEPVAAADPGWSGLVMPVEPPDEVADITGGSPPDVGGAPESHAPDSGELDEPNPARPPTGPELVAAALGDLPPSRAAEESSTRPTDPIDVAAPASPPADDGSFGERPTTPTWEGSAQPSPEAGALRDAAGRLASTSQDATRAALLLASHLVGSGGVEGVVAGRLEGVNALAVLTDQELLIVDERVWQPRVEHLAVDATLQVQGWDTGSTVAMVFTSAGRTLSVEAIPDKQVAYELAARVQARIGA